MNKKEVSALVVGLVFLFSAFCYGFYSEYYSTDLRMGSLPDGFKVYSYGPGGLVAKTVGSEVSYYHKDHLGSASLVSDSSGEIVYNSDYYPFGEGYNSEGDERFTYTGKEKDGSGLYYYGARYYDAVLGRFISPDPVNDVLFSPYVYVRDNPMKYVDPSGEVVILAPLIYYGLLAAPAVSAWGYGIMVDPSTHLDIADISDPSLSFEWKLVAVVGTMTPNGVSGSGIRRIISKADELLKRAKGVNSLKRIDTLAIKSVIRKGKQISVSKLDINDPAHFPTREELIYLGYDIDLLDVYVDKVKKAADQFVAGKIKVGDLAKVSSEIDDMQKLLFLGKSEEVGTLLRQCDLMLDTYRNKLTNMASFSEMEGMVSSQHKIINEMHKPLTE